MENGNFEQLIAQRLKEALGEKFDVYQQFLLKDSDINFSPDIFVQNPELKTNLAIEVKAFSEDVELPRAIVSDLIKYKKSLAKIGIDLVLVSTSQIPGRLFEEFNRNKILVIQSAEIDEIVSVLVQEAIKEEPPPSRKIGRIVKYTSSHGKTYYLHGKMTTLKGGGERMIYFFSGDIKEGVMESMPEGYEISEMKNGLPVLKKK